jgi:hypothetical protein
MSAILDNSAAIINDDESYQDMWRMQVEEAGYHAYIVRRPGRAFVSIEELATEVERHARFAVFDHRLAPRDFAQFSGAAIVAALYDRRTTAPLLVSGYEKQDADTSIRLHRQKVPVLLSSGEFRDPETIRTCFDISASEVWERQLPLTRRTLRTIVAIEYCTSESGIAVVDAFVPGWNTEDRVRFPVDLIGPSIRDRAKPGQRFFALVNTGAQRDEDLYFSDFELAPEPDSNDGLG